MMIGSIFPFPFGELLLHRVPFRDGRCNYSCFYIIGQLRLRQFLYFLLKDFPDYRINDNR